MNGNGLVCQEQHTLGYQATFQMYLALPSMGLVGGPNISPVKAVSLITKGKIRTYGELLSRGLQ